MKRGRELLVRSYKPKSFIFLVIVFLPNPSIFAASILLPLLAANASFKRSLSSSFEKPLKSFPSESTVFIWSVKFSSHDDLISKFRVSCVRPLSVDSFLTSSGTSSIVIVTHASKDKSYTKIVNQIDKKNYIIKKSKLIRIDDN